MSGNIYANRSRPRPTPPTQPDATPPTPLVDAMIDALKPASETPTAAQVRRVSYAATLLEEFAQRTRGRAAAADSQRAAAAARDLRDVAGELTPPTRKATRRRRA